MPFLASLDQLNQLQTSQVILATVVGLALFVVVTYYIGLLGWLIRILSLIVRGSIRYGFLLWRQLFSWASWPVFFAMELALLAVAWAGSDSVPGLAIFGGLVPLIMGVTACLAYMFIDLERYDVERGYKAVHNPTKGQELAQHLVRYGHQVDVPLLAAAALGVIGGFAMLNLGLYRSGGSHWYVAADRVVFTDFLAYALIHLYSIVDLLDLANSRHLLRIAIVKPAEWPASSMALMFRTFFTLVLLQQIFASVRKNSLLAEMIADFWSPHEPIHERAKSALPQYGPIAIGPLLISLRSMATLTKEQREQLPIILAMIGPSSIPTLVRHLRDPNEHVRAVAVVALGRLNAIDALPRLVSLCEDPSDVVRLGAVEALGAIGEASPKLIIKTRKVRSHRRTIRPLLWWRKRVVLLPPPDPMVMAISTLKRALTDSSSTVRIQAARALGRIGAPAAAVAPDLIALFTDSDETVRCQAAEALGSIGSATETSVQALLNLLQDASTSVKVSSARALGSLKTAAAPAVPALVPLLQDREESVRNAAAEAIAQVGPLDGAATDALIEGLASNDTVVQAHTAQALGNIGSAACDATPALAEALRNSSDRVRAKAAEALGKIGEGAAAAVPHLTRALRGEDNWVSALAAEALGEIGESADEAAPALIRSLKHKNPLVRSNAAEALGKMGAATARAALEKAARDEDGGVRSQAVRALGEIGPATTTTEKVVLDGLNDVDPLVRAAAVEAMGQWKEASEAAIVRLTSLLDDANDSVKVQAAQALPKLAGLRPEVIDGLCRRLLKDDSALVQMTAAFALGRLGPAASAAGAALLRIAQTGEECVREQVMRAIAMIQPPEIIEAFTSGLKDASVDIRKVASGGWMKAAAIPEEVIPALVEALRDPETQVRANAAHALGRLDPLPNEAIPGLIACASDANDGLRMNAAVALQRAPVGTIDKVMRQLVEDSNVRIRLVAAGILLTADPNDEKASAVIVDALGHTVPRVRKAALALVESLGDAASPIAMALTQRDRLEDDPELRVVLVRLIERQAKKPDNSLPLAESMSTT